ncbi:50S ribosomal protein L3 [candidate division WOR-3 bacterium]|nr:50S ribosomal protein L3 [candidate division WOR-3 bacterium]
MLIGRKLGMTRVFTESGENIPVTVIKASPCFIIDRRTEERDGYTAYVMGFGEKKEKRVKKPVLGLCKKAGVPPVEVIREFRVKDTSVFDIGEKVPVSVLQKGDKINVVGWSKGRGFQGVVKRWGFKGGPGSHGSTFHRAPGSAGAGTFPGRVLKGKKLPGRMGNDRVTAKNLEVVTLDEENGLIAVKGAVPGFRNGILLIKIGHDVDISARKELAKETAEKRKAEASKEKAEEATPELKEKVDETAEEKEKSTTDKKEKKIKDKTEKTKKQEEKEEQAEEKTEEATAEGKTKAALDGKEEVKKTKTETQKAEKKEEKTVAKEEKTEANVSKSEAEVEKAEDESKKVDDNKENLKKEDQNEKKGNS